MNNEIDQRYTVPGCTGFHTTETHDCSVCNLKRK